MSERGFGDSMEGMGSGKTPRQPVTDFGEMGEMGDESAQEYKGLHVGGTVRYEGTKYRIKGFQPDREMVWMVLPDSWDDEAVTQVAAPFSALERAE